MVGQIIAGGVSGIFAPFVGAWSQNKQIEAQQQYQQQLLEARKENDKQTLKLAGYMALGLGILLLIYFALKD